MTQKETLRKVLCCLLLLLGLCRPVLAELRLPDDLLKARFVYDHTNVISPQLKDSIIGFNEHLDQEYGMSVRLFVTQFTDDLNIHSYVQEISRQWPWLSYRNNSKQTTLLIVLSLGNETLGYHATDSFQYEVGSVKAAIENEQVNEALQKQRYNECIALIYSTLSKQIQNKMEDSTSFSFPYGAERYDQALPQYLMVFHALPSSDKSEFKSEFSGLMFLSFLYLGIRIRRHYHIRRWKIALGIVLSTTLGVILMNMLLP